MSPRRRAGRKILAAFLPIILIFLLALAALTGWLVYGVTHPPRRAYLVTPEKFASLSDRGLKATEETWANRDGTRARGWLVRGAEGAPAVVLLHRYGADRSWLLNLGVKLNETTNMTVLLPDLRGHGEQPPVLSTSLGTLAADDAGPLRLTTEALERCFPSTASVEAQTDLPSTGYTLASASPEEDEAYDRRVIEFFDRALRAAP